MLNRRNLRVKVLQLLYSYYNQSKHSSDLEELQRNLSKELSLSIKNIDKYFYDILSVIIVFMDINLEKKEIAKVEKIKKSPSRFNLSENPIIKFIKSNSSIIDGLISHNNKWDKKCDHLRDWYKILTEEEFYKDHISIENSNFEEDYSFFKTLILSFIIKNEEINKFFEKKDIYWNQDKIMIRSMLKKTIQSLNSTNFNTFAIASLSDDIEEDITFACSLFENATDNTQEYDAYIKKYAKNWDIERISLMDKSIIRMGIGEMVYFNNIPVKVTINECIDIAKDFSSPKSGNFVNGLLDVISLNLQKSKKINKTGKGLIDNK